ncbi:condensation domain-containing protein [Calothrix sp. PCC 7507]|uniref:condensation domain-containing protein n=1 Tax=Calothrix sp. PCC 7507 TaxID=99598 RepID=UPI00029EEAF9|nr:condensation domain-containing protein [Calothrix sp. PCC 7507]AFY33176.1 Glutamate racemase, Phenylalanine racemase (ATP-hydrolyzing) [Calothrix sp. PCC 7507]
MKIHSLLINLANQGVKLSVDEGSLFIDAPKGVLTPELRESLAKYKTDLLSLLRQNSNINYQETALPTIVPAPEQRYQPFPLTDMQQAFWVGRSGVIELGNVANHGYYEIESDGLNIERLNWALQKLIARHDMLRAVVLPDGQQQVLEAVPGYQIAVLDLRKQTQDVVAAQIELIRERMSHQVLPTDQWPLFEIRATYLDGEKVRLHISYDLQIFDAWSLLILFEEWEQIYQNPEVELPLLELSFRDYVLAEKALQNTDLYKRAQNYWFARLDSFPPSPDLPLAKHPSEIKQQRCQRYSGRLEKADWQQLKHRATQAGLTPSGVLIAAFAEILTIWSKSPQFTINLALFNRLPLHPQVNNILGDLSSVTLLAVDNSASESFSDRSFRIQQQLWQDLEHRSVSGVAVMRELARRQRTAPSAMPVVFTSTLGFSSRFSSLGQDTSTFSHFGELVYGISQASQVWMDIQVWEEKGALTFTWDVLKELFPEGMIDDMFGAYCTLIAQLAVSEKPWVATTQQLVSRQNIADLKYYVFNQVLADCPTWVPGEVYCSGIDFHQTHANFIIHPRTGERLYPTGDIGRYLPDGNLELLGRVSHQIRLGKYNIQPEEIELTLQQHPAISSAVVTAIEQAQNKKYLVAYLVSAQKSAPTTEELSQFLQQKLPDYMLPSAFVFLDALPLLANGTVDRNTLPHPELCLDVDVPYVAPQTELEQTIAAIWQEVLQLESVGIHHKFFEIGGNSLLIIQVFQKLQQVLIYENKKSVSLVDLFKYSTVHSLAKYLINHQETPNLIHDRQQEQEMQSGKHRIKQRLKKSQMLNNN